MRDRLTATTFAPLADFDPYVGLNFYPVFYSHDLLSSL